jgi:hypothetical protein
MYKYKQFNFFGILLLLLSCQNVICQSDAVSKSQFFDQKFKIIKNSLVHNDTATYRLAKDTPIRITKSTNDTVFIQLSQSEEVDVPSGNLLNKVEKPSENLYFLISEGSDKLRFTDFDVSPFVIPLKIRPALDNNPLQFLGDVSIGPYLGYQLGTKSYNSSSQSTQTALTFCVFGSPTLINLNPSNQSNDTLNNSSVLGISIGAGILLDVNNLQFGLVSGWDWISGTASESWVYQGKSWLSFSFAFNLSNN